MNAAPAHVVFRTDAGQRIGTGHVMRCLSIADRLRQAGVGSRFVCKAHDGHMAALLADRGYPCDLLPVRDEWRADGYLAWLGGPVDDDARMTREAIAAAGGAALLVVDHYALGADYHRAVRREVAHIAVIDDLPGRVHECDLLIDQNIGHTPADYDGRVPGGAPRLVGAAYAPVRAAFARLRDDSLRRRAETDRPRVLLISLGGADPDDVTSRAVRAVTPDLGFDEVHVVLSGIARHLDRVRAETAGRDDVILHVDTRDMPALMAQSDIAVGAAGVTAIERCVLGLPTLMVVVADNQIETAARMARLGAVAELGSTATVSADDIRTHLMRFAADPAALRDMSRAAADLCDGGGLDRLLPALLELLP